MTDKIDGRTFPKGSALAAGDPTAGYLGTTTALAAKRANPSQVFFTPDLDGDGLLRVYAKVNAAIGGRVAIKLHTGDLLDRAGNRCRQVSELRVRGAASAHKTLLLEFIRPGHFQ